MVELEQQINKDIDEIYNCFSCGGLLHIVLEEEAFCDETIKQNIQWIKDDFEEWWNDLDENERWFIDFYQVENPKQHYYDLHLRLANNLLKLPYEKRLKLFDRGD